MEFGSCDLQSLVKKEVEKYKCVREPTRVYIWFKMVEAVLAIHREGILLICIQLAQGNESQKF
jgi:hypothetical protein